MRHKSTASRFRIQLSSVIAGLSDLIKAIPVRRFGERVTPGVVFMVPEFYFAERSPDQRATQLSLKRKYETMLAILTVILRGAPNDLIGQLEDADRQFRDWLELDGSWSVTPNPVQNAQKAEAAARPLEQILEVLDLASKDELILVPDTNSLLSADDPIEYRQAVDNDSFVFMLLPTVLGELDRLKVEHRNDVVREKARKVITRIKGWRHQGPLATGVVVDKSITVKTSHSEPDMNKTLSWLDANNRDDRIVANILALQGEYASAHVILVSGDINLLNKADTALIETLEGP
jgi:hypothetical protein